MKSEDLSIFDHTYNNNDSKPSNDKDESILFLGLVNSLKKTEFGESINQLQFMRPHVFKFDDTSKVDEIVCNDWVLSCRNYGLVLSWRLDKPSKQSPIKINQCNEKMTYNKFVRIQGATFNHNLYTIMMYEYTRMSMVFLGRVS